MGELVTLKKRYENKVEPADFDENPNSDEEPDVLTDAEHDNETKEEPESLAEREERWSGILKENPALEGVQELNPDLQFDATNLAKLEEQSEKSLSDIHILEDALAKISVHDAIEGRLLGETHTVEDLLRDYDLEGADGNSYQEVINEWESIKKGGVPNQITGFYQKLYNGTVLNTSRRESARINSVLEHLKSRRPIRRIGSPSGGESSGGEQIAA